MGVTKESVVHFCRFCHRYLRPPWIKCERESKELLSLCLKKIHGLSKLKIVEAGFVWTESHSKRLKVRVTVQKELDKGQLLEQTFVSEFVESFTQCEDCKKEFTPHVWGALVQLRQRANHKKTFYFVEQLIIKHGVYDKLLKVEEVEDGLDFFYKTATHAARLMDFLGDLLPLSVKQSKQLISHDAHSNLYNYKYVYAVQIPSICREDLVLIPKRLATLLGGVSQVLLCHKVASAIHLVDPKTCKLVHLNSLQYFHHEKDIRTISAREAGTAFQVLDCERRAPPLSQSFSSYSHGLLDRKADLTLLRLTDYSQAFSTTHLPLNAGCDVLAFDLGPLGIDHDLNSDIVVAKRIVEKRARRCFKLKRLEQEGVMIEEGRKKARQKDKEQRDFDEFVEELEQDPDLRKNVNLYKQEGVEAHEDPDDECGVKLAELLNDLRVEEGAGRTDEEQFVQRMEGVQL